MSAPPKTAESAAAAPSTPSKPTATTSPAAPNAAPAATLEYDPLDDLDFAPLRVHPSDLNRLSASNLQIPPGIQSQIMSQKRYSLDSKQLTSASPTGVGSIASSIASRRGRSRSRSPSLRSSHSRTDRHSQHDSFSSLEDIVDPDILLDKMGFVELVDNKNNNKSSGGSVGGHNSYTFLTPVSERMSEDTLEDVHAFSDLSANTNTRPSSSVGTGGSTVGGEVSSHVLEPLYEGDDDDLDSDEDVKNEDERQQPSQVIVTNLENITIKDDTEP